VNVELELARIGGQEARAVGTGSAMQLSEAGEDELVSELDVYLSQPVVGTELFLLNYPQRIPASGIGSDRVVDGIRIRPRCRRVELSVSLYPRPEGPADTAYSEKSYDFTDDHLFDRPVGETQEFVSGEVDPPLVNLTACEYVPPAGAHEGHGFVSIVPIQHLARMRPSFAYLDVLDTERQTEKAMAKAVRDKEKGNLDTGGQGQDGDGDGADGDVQIEMTFMKRESDRAAERRKQSHTHLRKLEETDKWVKLDYNEQKRTEAQERHRTIFQSRPGDVNVDVDIGNDAMDTTAAGATAATHDTHTLTPIPVKKEEDLLEADGKNHAEGARAGEGVSAASLPPAPKSYMDMLYAHAPTANPARNAARQVGETATGHGSMRALRKMRPEGAIQVILTHARVIRTETLRECVPEVLSGDDLIVAVRRVAVLLRGCWVSSGPKRVSRRFSAHKLPVRLAASRTLVLNLFRVTRIVSVTDVLEKAFEGMIPPSQGHIEDFLGEVAEYKSGTGWVFRLEDDVDFEIDHPNLCDEENKAWDERVVQARKIMVGVATGQGIRSRGSRGVSS
jgi:RPC5 protein